jgi:hypothetical protein
MPIDISEYATPTLTKMLPRYPWVLDKNYSYRNLTINPRTPLNRYNSSPSREDGWKAPGYNVNHNSVTIEAVYTGTDTTQKQFKPY